MSFIQSAGGTASNVLKQGARRSFSGSSKNLAAAAEVKRLGVVGAGQMVSILQYRTMLLRYCKIC